MLDQLKPEKGSCKRCGVVAKSVGTTCCDANKKVVIQFDGRIGIALSRASDYVRTLPQRFEDVKQAADNVLLTTRALRRDEE